MRLISGVNLVSLPGAASTGTYLQLSLFRSGATIVRVGGNPNAGGPLAAAFTFIPLNWILLPTDQLELAGSFTNAGVNNTIIGYYWGYDVPRGNVEG
ncbi:MAG: hypothetical protein ACREJC_07145 [Tepidisphaeraceae bacterium]